MCVPAWPPRDHYDDNPAVAKHFSPTPALTAIARGHRYNQVGGRSIVDRVRFEVRKLYRAHAFERCFYCGLYWAGTRADIARLDRDKTMLLVVELREADIAQWWKIDPDIRRLLGEFRLSDPHGVCVRYYQHQRRRDTFAPAAPSSSAFTPSPTAYFDDSIIPMANENQSSPYVAPPTSFPNLSSASRFASNTAEHRPASERPRTSPSVVTQSSLAYWEHLGPLLFLEDGP